MNAVRFIDPVNLLAGFDAGKNGAGGRGRRSPPRA